jgi:mono/diheme cytochrome c family protein
MRRALPILCLLALAPADARAGLGDARRILADSCSRCHTAEPGGKGRKSPDGAPDLVSVVKHKGSAEVHAWLKGPSEVDPKATCDTSGLDPRFADDLLNYLVGLTIVPPAPGKHRGPEKR